MFLSDINDTFYPRGVAVNGKGADVIGSGFANKTTFKDGIGHKYNYRPGVFIEEKAFIETNQDLINYVDNINQDRVNNTNEINKFNGDIQNLKQHKQALQTNLDAVISEKQMADKKIADLEQTVSSLKLESSRATAKVASLETSVSDLILLRDDIKILKEGSKAIDTLDSMNITSSRILRKNNITTVSELADLNHKRLVKMGVSRSTATKIINDVNSN